MVYLAKCHKNKNPLYLCLAVKVGGSWGAKLSTA